MTIGAFTAILWGTATISGCGEPMVDVRGTVTQSSQPLAEGFVAFDLIEPKGRSVRRTAQLQQGQFSFEGAQALPPGVYRVTVTAGNPLGIVKQSGGGATSATKTAQARGVFVFDRVSVAAGRDEITLRLEDAQQQGGP
ncbi:MAG: hypothetical protein D6725_09530 [Planctomycetota bacterium]|nr:MAG: hypothetical protein D6725_09530 [Planctomycetota bacterium]